MTPRKVVAVDGCAVTETDYGDTCNPCERCVVAAVGKGGNYMLFVRASTQLEARENFNAAANAIEALNATRNAVKAMRGEG